MAKVTTICYGKKEEWKNADEAMSYFLEGIMNSEGSEQDRYACILGKLMMGWKVCSDED